MPRITRIAGSFVIVAIAYWAYALVAVPLIEPAADPRRLERITQQDRQRAEYLVSSRLKQLEGLFSPGAWELENPKILESDHAKLLLQEYNNLGDGRVEICPCTIVFTHDGPGDEAQRRRQSVILEAPGGALLRFDSPLDLNRAKVGRLVGGQLNGPITIRSDWKEPGPEDDLRIVTRDVHLTERTISTPHPVAFQWGPHSGRGRDMMIRLLTGQPAPGIEGAGPNITGIEFFELKHVERLHLDLGQTNSKKAAESSSVPVEIRCRGPFRFDAVGRVATFRDSVDVRKPNPSGPSDQLACELLSLYFIERSDGKPKGAAKKTSKNDNSLDLVAERIEARGNPVIVTAPSKNVVSRAQRLEYNLLANAITLEGGREVFLQQGKNEIHARSLYYKSAGPDRLGLVDARGPGWLRGCSDDRPDQQLEAVWKDRLRVVPKDENQVISLTGGAELKFKGVGLEEVGQLQAKEIHFYLTELPPTGDSKQWRPRPDGMLAQTDVRMNSPQLSWKGEDLRLWFEEPESKSGVGDVFSGRRNDGLPVAQSTEAAAELPSQRAQPTPLDRFEVSGRLLRARILLGGAKPTVSNLAIEDGVRLAQTQTTQPGEQPLLILGDRLTAENVTSPNAVVAVTGQPASFAGHGLNLIGSNINLDRGKNRLWINGVGQMDLPLPADLQGQKLTAPGTMTVNWQRGMEFDGHTAQFNQSVVATSSRLQAENETMQFQLRTETMRVQLQQPVSFSEPSPDSKPQVEQIQCNGGVLIENRSFDPQQQLTSYDRMQVTDLAVNVLSGALNGGPGWLNHVGLESDNPLGNSMRVTPVGATSSQNQLVGLHVRFQESLAGNLLLRQVTFRDNVRMAYAPVNSWDAMLTTSDPNELGPKGVVATCDQLSIVHMPLPTGKQRSIELDARGNTVVEGKEFLARSHEITYDQAKDLLILRGNGRSSAELYRQSQVGAPLDKKVAREIKYWRGTGRVDVVGAEMLEIGQPPGGTWKR